MLSNNVAVAIDATTNTKGSTGQDLGVLENRLHVSYLDLLLKSNVRFYSFTVPQKHLQNNGRRLVKNKGTSF